MTAVDQTTEKPARPPKPPRWLARLDWWTGRASDLFNPLLIKEARQSLKSLHFAITFFLMLTVVWGWTILALAWSYESINVAPLGPFLLSGYHYILAFPLLVLVPFTTYRSLAAEREDGTYEMLSITTLRPRQVILGKFSSAVLQMAIFLSAVTPCIAFTYLLRGVDVLTLVAVPMFSLLGSLALSALGLLLAASTRKKFAHMAITVVFLLAVFVAFWPISIMMHIAIVLREAREFVLLLPRVVCLVLTFGLSYTALFLAMASGYLAAPGENRSSAGRVVMFATIGLFAGWMFQDAWQGWLFMLPVWLCLAAVHWSLLGALMAGESGDLSTRVRRQLPKSVLARLLLTWFYPGGGTGYFFAVGGMTTLTFASLAVVIAAVANVAFTANAGFNVSANSAEILWFIYFIPCYVVIYLGVGRLVVGGLATRWNMNPLFSVIIHAGIFAIGCVAPMIFESIMPYHWDDTAIYASNPFVTIEHIATRRWSGGLSGQLPIVAFLLTVGSTFTLIANFFAVAKAVRTEPIKNSTTGAAGELE